MKNTARAVSTDLLRFFAASSIFYYHGGLFAKWPLSRWGECAAATFIYLTSFCAAKYSQSAAGRMRSYWWSRFKGIYPTFAVITLILFAASWIYAPLKTGSHYTWPNLAANLLMVSSYVGQPWFTEPMWFMPFVFQIYIILPFLLKSPIPAYALPAAFMVSGTASAVVYALHPADYFGAYIICRDWSPMFRLPEVLVGCMVARASSLANAGKPIFIYAGCCILASGLAVLFPGAALTALLPSKGVLVFLVLLAATAAVLPLVNYERSATIPLLGRASFPFFLLHGAGMHFISKEFGRNSGVWILYFVLCWAGAIVFSLALEKLSLPKPQSQAAPVTSSGA